MFSVVKIYSLWCHPFQERPSGSSRRLTWPSVVLLSCAHIVCIFFYFWNLSLGCVFLVSLSVLRCGQYRELTPCCRNYSRSSGYVEYKSGYIILFRNHPPYIPTVVLNSALTFAVMSADCKQATEDKHSWCRENSRITQFASVAEQIFLRNKSAQTERTTKKEGKISITNHMYC